jgi:hypothetical protein
VSVSASPRHRRPASTSANPDANERLTALTGAVLLVLFAAEGVTIVRVRDLLTLHFFLGMLLLGPVTLKIASTVFRFVRYYTGSVPYRTKGPPAPLLRVLGPMVIATSLGVLGTGVALAIAGPQRGPWLLLHKVTFVLWFGCMTIHVLAYAPRLPRLLLTRPVGRAGEALAGRRARWLLLAASLAGGLILAALTMHLSARWGGPGPHGPGRG